MKTLLITMIAFPLAMQGQLKLKHTDTVQRTFPAPATVGVDNVFGSIHVVGYNGQQVELTAVRTDEADTQELLDRAAREINTLKSEVSGRGTGDLSRDLVHFAIAIRIRHLSKGAARSLGISSVTK